MSVRAGSHTLLWIQVSCVVWSTPGLLSQTTTQSHGCLYSFHKLSTLISLLLYIWSVAPVCPVKIDILFHDHQTPHAPLYFPNVQPVNILRKQFDIHSLNPNWRLTWKSSQRNYIILKDILLEEFCKQYSNYWWIVWKCLPVALFSAIVCELYVLVSAKHD